MSLINSQVKSLKLNVTNIQSYLVSSNEKMRKLRSDKNNLIKTEQDKTKKAQKEKKIESSSSGLSSFGARVAKGLAKPFIGLFDRIKEFLGLIIAGIIVNNLPKLIEGITKTVSDISKIISQIGSFIGKNKWMLEGIKFMMTTFGVAVGPIIDLVKAITPSEQNRITKDSERIQDEFGRLDKDLEGDDEEINRRLNQYERNQARQTTTTTPPTTTQTPRSTPTGSPDRSFREPSTPTRTDSRVPKFAAGGRVEPRRTDTGTQPAARKSMTAATTSGRQTDGSVRSKRAVQTVNYFSFFNNNTRASEAIVEKDAKNKDTFKEILTSLKTIQDIRKQIGDDVSEPRDRQTPSPLDSPGGQRPLDPGVPISVDPSEILGTVGNTGVSSGAHLHIEDNSISGGPIPRNLLDNILVAGRPVSSGVRTSKIGWRRHPNTGEWRKHYGEDWDRDWNNLPISLRGGLKFVRFIPEGSDPRYAGYGNVLVIQNTDGKQYFLGHLNAGPRNPEALRRKAEAASGGGRITVPPGTEFRGQASYYGPGFDGNPTASGAIFDKDAMTAAHKTLKFGTKVEVTNLSNGKKVIVTINDDGPHIPGRIIDLSEGAMKAIGGIGSGVVNVKLRVLGGSTRTTTRGTPTLGPGSPGYGGSDNARRTALNSTSQNKDIIVAIQHIFEGQPNNRINIT
jgi:rare lipoprotein A (peptidoglycan hydrolase)